MSLIQIFKKVLIPCAAGVSSAGGPETHTYGPNCVKKAEPGTKASDLPIYTKECLVCRKTESEASPPSSMEETVGNIRRELWVWQDNLKGYRHKIVDVYRRGFSKADFFTLSPDIESKQDFTNSWGSEAVVEYLREPAHGPHRIGAIAISGLSGYILAMRRGKFRRLFYGTMGAAAMAALCYPEEAVEAVESVVLEGRRYFIIAYHFIYGETPKPPEWLEKFTGPFGSKEAEPQTNETNLDTNKALPNENKKQS